VINGALEAIFTASAIYYSKLILYSFAKTLYLVLCCRPNWQGINSRISLQIFKSNERNE